SSGFGLCQVDSPPAPTAHGLPPADVVDVDVPGPYPEGARRVDLQDDPVDVVQVGRRVPEAGRRVVEGRADRPPGAGRQVRVVAVARTAIALAGHDARLELGVDRRAHHETHGHGLAAEIDGVG